MQPSSNLREGVPILRILTILLLLSIASGAYAQSMMVFGGDGTYQGQVMEQPTGGQMYFDARGQYGGQAMRQAGGVTQYWGRQGETEGTTTSAPTVQPVTPTIPAFVNQR